MLKNSLSKIFKHDLSQLLKTSWVNIIGVSIFIGFLLFLLNIFLGLSLSTHRLTGELKDRLGMYFYIKDIPDQESETYKRVISLKDDLEAKGLKVMFSSKEDALAFLEKKIPDVVNNFEKFGIDNPLPSTLYVMFDSDSKYEALKTIIMDNKDIILNTKDVDSGSTLKQQENRVLTIINLSNFIVGISYTIITILFLIIVSFIGFLLNTIFHVFHRELEIKKTLGATYHQITKGFITLTANVLGLSFIICLALLIISGITINYYLYHLFDITIISAFGSIVRIIVVFLVEIAVILALGLVFSYLFANKLNKKL